MKFIDLEAWNRYPHYQYFKNFKDPFFNICTDVDVTKLKRLSSKNDLSFFILSIYVLLRAINKIDEFKYRTKEDGVICYDTIRAACTIMKNDRTFDFAYFDFVKDFELFYVEAEREIERVKKSNTIDPQTGIDDMVYTSVLPWISFNSVEHAKNANKDDSIPKIVFGKLFRDKRKYLMPVSVSVHHSLMDALHVGEFFKYYEYLCSKADKLVRDKSILL